MGRHRAVVKWILHILLVIQIVVDGRIQKNGNVLKRQAEGVQLGCPHTKRPICRGSKSSGPLPTYRSLDGSCHKPDPTLGMAGTPFLRLLQPKYSDGTHSLRTSVVNGKHLPSPRDMVNTLFRDVDLPSQDVNHFFMNWGQLIAHDLTLTNTSIPKAGSVCCGLNYKDNSATHQCGRIDIPKDDVFFSMHNVSCLGGPRSGGGSCERPQIDQWNRVTHYMDTSFIYSSDSVTSSKLRTFRDGKLASRSIEGETHLRADERGNLLAGDPRVGSTALLSAMYTVFLREHNRIATELQKINPNWNDETLFQETRRVVIAEFQSMTYGEWLPWLIGKQAMERFDLPSGGYQTNIDPRTSNDFTASAFRIFHSLIQDTAWLDRNGTSSATLVDLRADVVTSGGLQGVIEGMLYQPSQIQDRHITDQIKNRWFAHGKPYGTDVISTDIFRGRDHGLPTYNDYREFCGLRRARNWEDFSDMIREEDIESLKTMYASHEDVDSYVGGLLEQKRDNLQPASIVSPTIQCIVADQFYRTKFGDPYFFDLDGPAKRFTQGQLHQIRQRLVSKLLCDNIPGLKTVPRFAFLLPNVYGNSEVSCEQLPGLELSHWGGDFSFDNS